MPSPQRGQRQPFQMMPSMPLTQEGSVGSQEQGEGVPGGPLKMPASQSSPRLRWMMPSPQKGVSGMEEEEREDDLPLEREVRVDEEREEEREEVEEREEREEVEEVEEREETMTDEEDLLPERKDDEREEEERDDDEGEDEREDEERNTHLSVQERFLAMS